MFSQRKNRRAQTLLLKAKCVLVISLACFLFAASSAITSAQLRNPTAPPPADAGPTDPLHRETPRSTVEGMLTCGERQDFACIARYLEPVPGLNLDPLELAREFHALRTRYKGNLASFSEDPNGRLEKGLPPGQQRAGVVETGGTTTEVLLVRVDDPNYGKIWLVSSETVAKIPQLYGERQAEPPTKLSESGRPL